MAPSLIRSACRKSPSEGGAEEVVLIVCRHCTALLSPNDGHSSCHRSRARFYIVTSRSFSFSVEFASLVNLDIYCFSLSFFSLLCIQSWVRKRFISSNTWGDCVATNGTYLTPRKFYWLLACCFHMKSASLGIPKRSLKNGLKCILYWKVYLFFCTFSDFSPLTSHFLTFAWPGFITLHEFVNFYREDTLEGWQWQSAAGPKKREQQTNADKLQLNIAFEFNFISIWRYSS